MANNPKRALIVEDDGTLRTLYVDILEAEGFQVDQAVEGHEGLEKAQIGGYDLILLDILLPGLEGTKILEALKQKPPQVPNGPMIMLTNQDQPEILQKCRELGAAGAIIKSSIVPDQLMPSIRRYLKDEGKSGPEA